MKTIKDLKATSISDADAILTNGLKTVTAMETVLTDHFNISNVETVFQNELTGSEWSGNGLLEKAMPLVRCHVNQAIHHIQSLERFLIFHIPQMEDGNNFGVNIQLTVLEALQKKKEELMKKSEEDTKYWNARADAMDKLGTSPKTILTETKLDTSGDETKSITTLKEEKTTTTITDERNRMHPRYQQILALDVHCYATLKNGLMDCITIYIGLLDMVEKNKDRLVSPKGKDGGRNIGMY